MKLLFITKDWRQGIERNTVSLSAALGRLAELTEWHEDGDIHDIVGALPQKPDFILLNDLRPTRCPEITGLDRLRIPFGAIVHDLNYRPDRRKAFIADNNVRHLFVHYRDIFLRDYAEFANRMIWLPHWVDTGIFRDYGQPKSYEFLLMGCVEPSIYPLRARILETLHGERGFVHHPHPGYGAPAYTEDRYIVGSRYAKEINKAKLFLTDGAVFSYLVMKYFEVPACNTLLLAPYSKDAADAGFVPGVNFVDIDEYSFADKARYYAAHYDTAGKSIAQRGYELVRSRHSAGRRAAELAAHIKRILLEDGP